MPSNNREMQGAMGKHELSKVLEPNAWLSRKWIGRLAQYERLRRTPIPGLSYRMRDIAMDKRERDEEIDDTILDEASSIGVVAAGVCC